MSLNQEVVRVVLYEAGNIPALSATQRYSAMTALLEKGFSVTRSTGTGAVSKSDGGSLIVLGQFGTATLPQAENLPADVSVSFRDISGYDSAQIADVVEGERSQKNAAKHGEWKPWFPVIDYDRCTNCMQCLSFCLFGVYGVDQAQKIQVQNNDSCKTNCPACSRVCPEAAIMFPKYKSGPINGDVVSESDLEREKMKIDISALLGGDIYSMLRARSERAKSRFSKERDSDKALKERQRCLTQLAKMGDIPPEVLMSLPSPDEIQRRAEEAAAKAKAALQGGA